MLFEILDPKNSLYLDASAGSGKTKLLVDRIIKLLLTGTQPSRILCITFTKAAADEMYERLEAIILTFVTLDEEALKAKLQALYCPIRPHTIKEARGLFATFMEEKPLILTLHAFCAKILQRLHFIEEEELENGGKILEEDERRLLFEDVFYRLLLEKQELDPEIKFLLQEYEIRYLIDLLEAFWISLSNSRNSLVEYDLPKDELAKFLSELLKNKLQIHNLQEINLMPNNKEAIQLCFEKIAVEEEVLSFVRDNLLDNFSYYKNFFLTKDCKARAKLLKASLAKDEPEIEFILRCEQERLVMLEEALQKLEALKKNLAFNLFAWEVLGAFQAVKKAENLLEYSDLIVTVHSLFASGQGLALLYSLDLQLEQLMIDEAQDLSEIQWSLIQTITEEFFAGEGISERIRTIFIVGDFKQAIFGFQGSAPEIFQAIKLYYRKKITILGQGWREFKLETCYRCVPEILEVVDIFCNQEYAQNAFQICEKITHKAHKPEGLGKINFEQIMLPELEKSLVKWEIPGAQAEIVEKDESFYIAQAIIEKILLWTDEKRLYGPNLQVLPQSILILFKKRCKLQDDLIRGLENAGIPVTNLAAKVSSFSGVFYHFISLIQFLVQPLDDMNLFALLQGEPFNLNEQKLLALAYRRTTSLWEQATAEIPLLNILHNKAQELDLENFLYYYLQEIYPVQSQETEEFLNYFLTYSRSNITISYRDFLIWLEQLLVQKGKKVYDNRSVRITTVHSAKGLEAPIVILADAAFAENTTPKRFSQVGPLLVLKSKATASLIDFEERREERERLRLLYVAMTRAQYELHIFGHKMRDNSWFKRLSELIQEKKS